MAIGEMAISNRQSAIGKEGLGDDKVYYNHHTPLKPKAESRKPIATPADSYLRRKKWNVNPI